MKTKCPKCLEGYIQHTFAGMLHIPCDRCHYPKYEKVKKIKQIIKRENVEIYLPYMKKYDKVSPLKNRNYKSNFVKTSNKKIFNKKCELNIIIFPKIKMDYDRMNLMDLVGVQPIGE